MSAKLKFSWKIKPLLNVFANSNLCIQPHTFSVLVVVYIVLWGNASFQNLNDKLNHLIVSTNKPKVVVVELVTKENSGN